MGKRILLADDSITIQKVIELTFSDEDFDVVTVGNGRLAIERVQDLRPDLVLCDIIMPEKDGYEVCDFIKKNPALSHIPVLLLTGAFEPFDQERATRVGCDGFLAKPFEPQTLIAKVKELLSRSAAAIATPSTPAATAAASPPPAPAREEAPAWGAVPEAAAAGATVPAWSVPAPTPASPAPEAIDEPAFFTDESFGPQAAPTPPPASSAGEAADLGPDLSLDDFSEDYHPGAASAVAPEAPVFEAELYPVEEPARDEFVPMSAEESATLHAPAGPASAPLGGWTQETVEVPLEDRARASVDAQIESESLFEEVFDEPPAPPAPASKFPTWPTVMMDESPLAAPPPAPLAPPAAPPESFAELAPAEAPATAPTAEPSEAVQVAVSPDMVSQIAQRVVAQISEKVIREIAWEVIPELAETLIKKEIERLKADLG